MSLYQLNEGQAVATLRAQLALRDRERHDVETMLEAIKQDTAAIIASAADDCRDERICRHCGRRIINDDGRWVDPEATGDDSVWRDACDANETFTAEHEPDA